MNGRNSPTRCGFTLLEVILAVGMVAMLSLSLYASLRTAFRARESAMAAVGPARTAQIAMELARQDLELAMPPTGILAGMFVGQHTTEGGSEADSVMFYAMGTGPDESDATGGPGLRKVELAVVSPADGGPRALVRRITTNLLAPVEPSPEEEVLCRGVKSFMLRYYDGSTWQETWDSTTMDNALPLAVELTLELEYPPGAPTVTRRLSRIVPLACHKDLEMTVPDVGGGE